ncbi:MAG: DNA methyltransferase [Armatimonadota bacterium]|nr:MAG: DNA methyltransferase [Armatimonadota bacterium]
MDLFDIMENMDYFLTAPPQSGRKPAPVVTRQGRTRARKLIAFGWYGGKYSHLDWLLPLLPRTYHYCEPFGGSAAVLLNRAPSPVETYNDLDGEVVKRARRFYVRARQARTGLAQTATLGRWANCIHTSRRGMSGVVSRWLGGIEMLPEIAERLLRVQIENRPAIEVIKLYDSPNTLFYCDPPYPPEARKDRKAYGFEMDEASHRELAKVLHACQGKVAISGYRCDLMDELYGDWKCILAPVKTCIL